MKVELTRPLRVEITPVRGRLVCRLFHGDEEKVAGPALLDAVASLIAGQRHPAAARVLSEAGILVPEAAATATTSTTARLRSSVSLNLRLRPAPGTVQGPRGPRFVQVTPDNSLPIGLFVPPAVLASLQQLDRALKTAWMTLLRVAHSRGLEVDEQAATEILAGIVDEHLASDGVLSRVLTWKDERRSQLEVAYPLQGDAVAYPLDVLTLVEDRRAAGRPDAPRLSCAVGESPEALIGVGTLLGRLSRGERTEAIEQLVVQPGMQVARQLWHDLLRHGWVEHDVAPPALIALDPGQVMHLGHATLLARLGEAHVLVDPWIIPASASDAIPPIAWSQLPPLDAVFITHHHWDHVNLETLLELDKSVPVYLPRQSSLAPLQPKTAALLRTLGFAHVHTLAHDDGVDFEGGGRVEAAPFYGEDPTGIGYGANTYLLIHDARAALVHVDSGTDLAGASLVSRGDCARLVAAHGDLSPVFATRRQERGTMVEHSWEYLLQPTRAWVQPTENCCNDAAFLAALTEACRCEHLVLYSEGGADHYPVGTDFLRGTTPRFGDAVHEYGWDSLETIRAAVSAAGATVHGSAPGQVFRIGAGGVA